MEYHSILEVANLFSGLDGGDTREAADRGIDAAERGAAGAAATAAAVAAAAAAAAEAAAFEDGNPNYGDGEEKADAVIADLLLIQELDKNPRVPKYELYRYNVLPEELTALGPRVRELGDDLYEALGLSSMDRRSFVQMKLKHQAHHPIARALLEKINKNMEKLETIPLEMERIKDRPVIHLKDYLFKEPELLPKPKDPKKRKVKR